MWLEHLQMNHLADLMVENDIDGKTLMTLNGDDLVDLGVESVCIPSSILFAVHLRP